MTCDVWPALCVAHCPLRVAYKIRPPASVPAVLTSPCGRRPVSDDLEISVDVAEFSRYIPRMLKRLSELKTLRALLKDHPVVGIIGARQVGKTTLARILIKEQGSPASFFDLENSEDLSRLSDPLFALKRLKGLVVIDEVQQKPEMFRALRVLADRPGRPARFLILGSASPQLLRQSSETLAGRIAYHELGGFSLEEAGVKNGERLWIRGGFPKSFLAGSEAKSFEWRQFFIKNFLERDLPQLGVNIRAVTLRRFWTMLANYHGQQWNGSEFGRSFGVADTTVRHYLDILTSALVVRQLLPWHENIGKRQIKTPKVYILDSGLLHTLLNLRDLRDLEGHPKVGSSWEGFVIHEVIRRLGALPEECFYWGTHAGAELDLLIVRGRVRLGFEIKRTSSPIVTPSMSHALKDLKLKELTVIHAGEKTYQMTPKIKAVAFTHLLKEVTPFST